MKSTFMKIILDLKFQDQKFNITTRGSMFYGNFG